MFKFYFHFCIALLLLTEMLNFSISFFYKHVCRGGGLNLIVVGKLSFFVNSVDRNECSVMDFFTQGFFVRIRKGFLILLFSIKLQQNVQSIVHLLFQQAKIEIFIH